MTWRELKFDIEPYEPKDKQAKPTNRFHANEKWFTSDENEIGKIIENDLFTLSVYHKSMSDGEKQWDEYAIVNWSYGAAHLICVLSNGAFVDGQEYISRPTFG